MGRGEVSSSKAMSLNKRSGKVQDRDVLHLISPYPGKDLGELERRVDLPNCDMYHMGWLGFFCGSSHICGWAVDLDYPWLFWLDTLHFPVSKPWPGCQTAAISHSVARLEDLHLRCWKKKSFLELTGKLQSPEIRDLGVRDQNQNFSPNIALNSQALVQFVRWFPFSQNFYCQRSFTLEPVSNKVSKKVIYIKKH